MQMILFTGKDLIETVFWYLSYEQAGNWKKGEHIDNLFNLTVTQ